MHFGAIFSAVIYSLEIDFKKIINEKYQIKGQKDKKYYLFLKIQHDKYQRKLCFALL